MAELVRDGKCDEHGRKKASLRTALPFQTVETVNETAQERQRTLDPILPVPGIPLHGINFTQDTISYKVRHEYGGAVVDYRGVYLINT